MAELHQLGIPEIGQIVAVRQRRFVVSEILPSALPPEILQKNLQPPQHLVTLSSIEDDALGETLQVVWEIEPDAQINEKVGLPEPTGFDAPERFDAFLNELAAAIQNELADPGVVQLILPTFEEQEQLKINLDSLRRLRAIPAEIEQEQQSIQNRFANPQTRMFPVAVAFLVPIRYSNLSLSQHILPRL
jgi:hypothetical protein